MTVTAPSPTAAVPEGALLAGLPPVRRVDPALVARAVRASSRPLVVLDDDPTGTQTVAGVPVLTRWSVDDLRWALRQRTPALYVLTNTRSLGAAAAAERTREVVDALVRAAALEDTDYAVVSRGDSTLRGHFPLETDVLDEALAAATGRRADGVILCPSYIDAGRLTVGDVHWMRTPQGLLPVGRSEFARDATFGYRASDLREFVQEKTAGRIAAADVLSIGLGDIRSGGPRRVAELLGDVRDGRVAVLNAAADDDLRVGALGLLAAEARGQRFLYRTGPSFVRARAGMRARPPLTPDELDRSGGRGGARHGLVVVGSHVALTTRQLERLRRLDGIAEIEVDVARLLEPRLRDVHVAGAARRAIAALAERDVVLRTSREVMTGRDRAASLALSREVSGALVEIVRLITAMATPRFVVAKGGITSSDVATRGLGIRRAWVRGTLLPGIVSLWTAADGIACGLPYVVFAGNVGDDDSLARVVANLRGER